MAFLTQGDAVRNIKEIAQWSSSGENVLAQFAEQNGMVSIKRAFAHAAFLACVIISLKYSHSPFFVLANLSKIFLSWSNATFPFVMLWTACFLIAFQECGHEFWKPEIMSGKKFRNTVAWMMIPVSNCNFSSTATLAEMFAGIFFYPFICAEVMCSRMISWVFGQTVAFSESSIFVSGCFEGHKAFHALRFNGRSQEKLGELLETLAGDAEGNQQPSAENWLKFVSAKVQRLVGEDTNPIISHKRPTVECTTDDIVQARRNAGRTCPSPSLQRFIFNCRYVYSCRFHIRHEHQLH